MQQEQPGLTSLGKLVIFIFILGCIAGGGYLIFSSSSSDNKSSEKTNDGKIQADIPENQTTIGIAYGTEKRRWLTWAVEEFKKTEDGKKINIELIPMGSIEGADAIISGDKNIHVWSPASAAYKDKFVQDYELKFNKAPIINNDDNKLVLTPMVFVMWKDRYEVFIQKYGKLSSDTIRQAMVAKEGWAGIQEKAEWGYFKYGYTNPKKSNSGLLALILAAYDFHNKLNNLQASDIVSNEYRNWSNQFENGASTKMNSTGNLMQEMVSKGASVYDVIFVYENLAMSYCENAKGRSGEFIVIYPEKNIWNENPYYILDAPWSSAEQTKSAQIFYDFLKSEKVQQEAVNDGFRPDNLNVPIKFPTSPFIKYAGNGILTNINSVCEPPSADVITNIFIGWDRKQQ